MAPFVSLSLLLLFLNHPLLSLSTNPEGMAYCFISLSLSLCFSIVYGRSIWFLKINGNWGT